MRWSPEKASFDGIVHRVAAISHQRRGIGKALLSALLAALNKRGVAKARFDVVASNEDAIPVNFSCGPYRVGETINGIDMAIPFAISTDKMIDAVWRSCQ